MSKTSFEIDVDGQKIRGNLYEPAEKTHDLTVLFLHGWTGEPNDRSAETLTENGFYSMTISMRGHGNSDGDINQVSRADSLKDALAAYDFLASKLPNGVVIAAVGNSYGSYIAALLSRERDVAALSLRVPAPYVDEGFELSQMGHGAEDKVVMNWRQSAHEYTGNKAFEAVHNFEGPVQIIEAEKDDTIPRQSVQNYKNAISNTERLDYHLMPDWPHSLGNDPERNKQFQGVLLSWLESI